MIERNERTCIATRKSGPTDGLIRFVTGPDGAIVPDLKRNLPGRGCWVTAERGCIDLAVRRNLFRRAMKSDVHVAADLATIVDALLTKAALGSLGLCRKAGSIALGAAKVDSQVRSGKALCVLHAREASTDGVRKIDQARRAVEYAGGPDIPSYKLFSEVELGLAFGAANVIHAAVIASRAGEAALRRVVALDRYRADTPVNRNSDAAAAVEGL